MADADYNDAVAALEELAKVKPGTSVASQNALKAGKAKVRSIRERHIPIPPIESTPEPPSSPDVFYGTAKSQFSLQGGPVSEVAAPDGSGDTVFRLDCSDTDGLNITSNPRSQMLTDGAKVKLPNEFWWSGAFWLPTTFPAEVPGWWNLAQLHGPPYAGSPPIELDLGGKNVGWTRNGTGNFKTVWTRPYTRGKKNTFLLHIILGSSGLVEMWLNGEQVCSSQVPTIDSSNKTGPQSLYLQNYRQKSMFSQTIPVYHWPMKVGTTRASVGG